MNDETMGQEDAAQDAEACAEALESLDQIALAEIAFDDSSVDVQDEPEIEAPRLPWTRPSPWAIFPCRPFPRHARPRFVIARCRPSAAI